MKDFSVVSGLIAQLLRAKSPELGARLKQRLNLLLTEQGLPYFNEREHGFNKFTDFLKETQSTVVRFEPRDSGGDIWVSLVPEQQAQPAKSPLPASDEHRSERTPIRNDVWQAFANTDPGRKRFLHKSSHQVRHFVEKGAPSAVKDEVLASPQDYAEIQLISGEQQSRWMAEFLNGIPLHGENRTIFEPMLNAPYSSNLNSVFTGALKERGEAWKRMRAERINQHIDDWAARNSIDLNVLRRSGRPAESLLIPVTSPLSSLRSKVHKLLELVSDEDIEKLILPTLLTTISIRARQ